MRIVTITPNTAVDETIDLDRLVPGTVHRARSVRFNAGGKGVNVSSCLADWGVTTAMTGFVGKENAAIFENLCRDKRIEDRLTRVSGFSRTNIKLVHQQETTDINLPSLEVQAADIEALEGEIDVIAPKGPGIAVLAGSLPASCPADFYVRLVKKLNTRGFKIILDTAGAPLNQVLAAPVLPFCVKPNLSELAEWAGADLKSLDDVAAAARSLRAKGIGLVAVSLGKDGALFLSEEGMLIAQGEAGAIVSTAGAGDAMVAGIVAALVEGGSLERIARLSTAFAIEKLAILGPNLPEKAKVETAAQRVLVSRRAGSEYGATVAY